jgi:hypothetical protein
MTDYRAHQLVIEPDQAKEHVINLLRKRRKFVLEVDPTLPQMKDVVCIAIGGEFQERRATHDYLKEIAVQTLDDAIHFGLNCLRHEVSFAVAPMDYPGGRTEWKFTAERPRRHPERRTA